MLNWVMEALLVGGTIVLLSLVVSLFMRRGLAIRFGHAFPNPDPGPLADPIADACDILMGSRSLGPRDPVDTSSVWSAEGTLGIRPDKRPVYAYVGCLHPALGRIGLILRRAGFWREPHGVSRCDTGGLAGRVEGFSCLTPTEAALAVKELSYPANVPWERHLNVEVAMAYGFVSGWTRYLRGEIPKLLGLCGGSGRLDRHRGGIS